MTHGLSYTPLGGTRSRPTEQATAWGVVFNQLGQLLETRADYDDVLTAIRWKPGWFMNGFGGTVDSFGSDTPGKHIDLVDEFGERQDGGRSWQFVTAGGYWARASIFVINASAVAATGAGHKLDFHAAWTESPTFDITAGEPFEIEQEIPPLELYGAGLGTSVFVGGSPKTAFSIGHSPIPGWPQQSYTLVSLDYAAFINAFTQESPYWQCRVRADNASGSAQGILSTETTCIVRRICESSEQL